VIDSDYRGNVGVILYNHSDDDFIVNKGDRVAQLICEMIVYPEVVEFKVCCTNFNNTIIYLIIFVFLIQTLDETDRGEGGFGSTGTN